MLLLLLLIIITITTNDKNNNNTCNYSTTNNNNNTYNHNYIKILESDWSSAGLISAVIVALGRFEMTRPITP